MPWAAQNKGYLRHLADLARHHLGPNITLFTTDPPDIAHLGTLQDPDIYTCVRCSHVGGRVHQLTPLPS